MYVVLKEVMEIDGFVLLNFFVVFKENVYLMVVFGKGLYEMVGVKLWSELL